MSPASIVLLTFFGAGLLVIGTAGALYDTVFRYRTLLKGRLSEIAGEATGDRGSLLIDFKQIAAQASHAQGNWRFRLRNFVQQADLPVDLRTLVAVSASLCAGLATVAGMILKNWWLPPCGLVVGIAAPFIYVHVKRVRRLRKMSWQLPDAFDVIGRGVRTGQTLSSAFQTIADEFDPPIADEFRNCYEQQNLGMSYDAALRDLARRTPMMELRILVVALLVQSRSGGNLTALLASLSTMVRKRLKMQQRMRSLTGEGRMQAAILMVLPILAFFILLVVAPDYSAELLARPWLLLTTGGAQLLGAVWIRQIVRFEC
jgi:tight adherence protein B